VFGAVFPDAPDNWEEPLMWHSIPSLTPFVQALAPTFTAPSFLTHCMLLLGWLMCPGCRTLFRVGETTRADEPLDHSQRHPFDRFYNFFSRSRWTVSGLAYRVAVLAVTHLKISGPLYLIVDDTLLHKRGLKVWGLGWFRDAVASTKKRVATASGNNWVVLGLAVPVPFCPDRILCLPLLARLHLPGQGQPGCATLARQMLDEVRGWFPGRTFVLLGDGAYASKALLQGLPDDVTFVGRLRGDAAVYDPRPPRALKGRRGPKPKKGPRLPSPKAAAAKADRQRVARGPWRWQAVTVTAYGRSRALRALSYQAVWPAVLGVQPVRVVVVRDPEGTLQDSYLFTTSLAATAVAVIEGYARRWSIEALFRSSKQELDIEGPQHWCRASIEKLAPWVWLMQSVVTVWYLSVGHDLPIAQALRETMGGWDSECALRHMLKVLRQATLDETINITSSSADELRQMVATLKNCVILAA
jgi:DDE superfamily endonuclease